MTYWLLRIVDFARINWHKSTEIYFFRSNIHSYFEPDNVHIKKFHSEKFFSISKFDLFFFIFFYLNIANYIQRLFRGKVNLTKIHIKNLNNNLDFQKVV